MNNMEEIDEDFNKRYNQFQDDFETYMINYIIPNIVAYQIAQSHYRSCLSKISFERHYNSMSDIINVFPKLEVVKNNIKIILNIKYDLTIVNEEPLVIDKWK